MIVLQLPSRGRPDNMRRLLDSLTATTRGPWAAVVLLDDDDSRSAEYPQDEHLIYRTGPRRLLSVYWNDAHMIARSELPEQDDTGPTVYMHAGDDITFRTLGWDQIVQSAFPEDGIAFVHGDDLSPNARTLGTHGFLRAEWIDTVGYFVPPYFSCDFNDTWLTEVGDLLDRRIYVPVVTEHHHPAFGKAEWDESHLERIARGRDDDVLAIWNAHAGDRYRDAAKLRERMVMP